MKRPLWRLAQYAATIIVWTAAGAGVFALSSYVQQYAAEEWTDQERARKSVEADSIDQMKWRAALGGALGALGSCLYVAKCILKKQEP